MRSDISNTLITPVTDACCMAAMGMYDDKLLYAYKFGYNPDVDTGADEDVWSGGGAYAFYPAAAVSIEVLSSDVNDASAGTGARTVEITGLDAEGLIQTKTAVLNGTSVVAVTGTWLRVYDAKVLTVGSGGANAGNITVRQASAGATGCYIIIGENQSAQAIYTVPRNYIGMLKGGHACVGKTSDAKIMVQIRNNGIWYNMITHHVYEGQIALDSCVIAKLQPMTDIRIRCSSTSTNIVVSADFHLLLTKL